LIISNRSFTYLFTATDPVLTPINQTLFPLIYSNYGFCKSCDRIKLKFNSLQLITSTIKTENLIKFRFSIKVDYVIVLKSDLTEELKFNYNMAITVQNDQNARL
jgi:hypothetical protein